MRWLDSKVKVIEFLTKYKLWIIGAGLFLALFLDKEVALEISEDEHAILRTLASYITDVALGLYWIIGSLLLILVTTLIIRSQRAQRRYLYRLLNVRNLATHLLLSILSTGSAVMILKFLVGRARPAIGNDNLNVFYADPFNLNSLYQSFPSGHTQVIFCVGTMLSYLWPKRRIEFLAVALSIALTRVLAMEHFVSDVYVGMLIGTLGCNASVNFWSRWVNRPGPWKAI